MKAILHILTLAAMAAAFFFACIGIGIFASVLETHDPELYEAIKRLIKYSFIGFMVLVVVSFVCQVVISGGDIKGHEAQQGIAELQKQHPDWSSEDCTNVYHDLHESVNGNYHLGQ